METKWILALVAAGVGGYFLWKKGSDGKVAGLGAGSYVGECDELATAIAQTQVEIDSVIAQRADRIVRYGLVTEAKKRRDGTYQSLTQRLQRAQFTMQTLRARWQSASCATR